MRAFTDFEKHIIERIIKSEPITGQCLATLIDEEVDVSAIEWCADSYKLYKYCKSQQTAAEEIANKNNLLIELIFLLKYLESERLIYLYQIKDFMREKSIYNHTKYILTPEFEGHLRYAPNNPNGINAIEATKKLKRGEDITGLSCHVNPNDFSVEFYFNIGDLLEYYASSIFYPSNSLRELVKDKFKSKEQKNHNQTLIASWVAIFVALGLGVLGICSRQTKDKTLSSTAEKTDSIVVEIIKPVIMGDSIKMDSVK